MFFSILESLKGEEMTDANGKVIGRQHKIGIRPAGKGAVADMLRKLSEIELLHP
jgi:hypothetical protein